MERGRGIERERKRKRKREREGKAPESGVVKASFSSRNFRHRLAREITGSLSNISCCKESLTAVSIEGEAWCARVKRLGRDFPPMTCLRRALLSSSPSVIAALPGWADQCERALQMSLEAFLEACPKTTSTIDLRSVNFQMYVSICQSMLISFFIKN